MFFSKIPFYLNVVVVTASVLFSSLTHSQEDIIPPPWIMHSDTFLALGHKLSLKDAQSLLPSGVEALADENGMVTAMLEMYKTDKTYGVPNYTIVFLVLDVKGHDSSSKMPGHFVVWGNVGSQAPLDHFVSTFGFPYTLNENVAVWESNGNYMAILEEATKAEEKKPLAQEQKPLLKVSLKPDLDKKQHYAGDVNLLAFKGHGEKAQKQLVVSTVPYLTEGYASEVLEYTITSDKHPVLNILKKYTPVWAVVSTDQMFSYSNIRLVNQ